MYCYSKIKSKQTTIFTKINKTGYSVIAQHTHWTLFIVFRYKRKPIFEINLVIIPLSSGSTCAFDTRMFGIAASRSYFCLFCIFNIFCSKITFRSCHPFIHLILVCLVALLKIKTIIRFKTYCSIPPLLQLGSRAVILNLFTPADR